MYVLIAAGVTSASQTSAAGAAIVTDALAISPVFIDTLHRRGWRGSPGKTRGDRHHRSKRQNDQ
jgi:hypothetical protein